MKLGKKKLGIIGLMIVIVVALGLFFGPFKNSQAINQSPTETITNGNLSNILTASGEVQAQNQANLTFLTAGRVAYLGVKEGDQVKKGEVLANLDTTVAAHNVTAAQAQQRSAKAAFDKVIDDIHLFQYGNGGFDNVGTANETQDQKTKRQQAEEAINVAYDNLQSAKKQLELQSIVAPFEGTVLSIQNISEGTNVSPTSGSTITVVGGGELKFVANVLEQDIDQIHENQAVTIKLDAKKDLQLSGTITKITAGKTALPDGRNVFRVDIQSTDLQTLSQAGQTGSIEISIDQAGVTVVPSWTVLGSKYVWVMQNGQATLKEVKVGTTVNGNTIIISGLGKDDQIILNPEIITKGKYKIL